MNSIKKRLSRLNGTVKTDYAALVDSAIRKRYSVSDELAILRQRDIKPDEFAEYNTYVEKCKADAKAALGIYAEGDEAK